MCVCVMKNSIEADFYKVSCSINNRLSRISDKASLTGKVFIGQTMTFWSCLNASKNLIWSEQTREKYGSLNLKKWLIAYAKNDKRERGRGLTFYWHC